MCCRDLDCTDAKVDSSYYSGVEQSDEDLSGLTSHDGADDSVMDMDMMDKASSSGGRLLAKFGRKKDNQCVIPFNSKTVESNWRDNDEAIGIRIIMLLTMMAVLHTLMAAQM